MGPEPPIQAIVDKIVATAAPVRVILFGSAARGNRHPNSDVDLLVVVKDGVHRRKIAERIYLGLLDIGFATDVVVAQESDLVRHRDNPGLIFRTALAEGRVLYAA